jgi:hypothetical protein
MTHSADNDARGIIYIDAPLPATVLAEAYRMHAEWQRRQRLALLKWAFDIGPSEMFPSAPYRVTPPEVTGQ